MSLNVSDQTIATRRGILFGMTLAEVLLIVLFCILLLLSANYFEKEKLDKKSEEFKGAMGQEAFGGMSPDHAAALGRYKDEAEKNLRKGEDPSEFWRNRTNNPPPGEAENRELTQQLIGKDRQLEEGQKEIEKLQKDLDDAKNKQDDLKEEVAEKDDENKSLIEMIREAKAGDPPSCMYYGVEDASGQLRYRTLALGLVHVESERLTLISINNKIPDSSPVDFFREPMDWESPYRIMSQWPVGVAMSFDEFGEWGQQFIDIGDIEVADKLKCRFMMDYVFQDGTKLDTFENVFQKYFYKNIRRYL